ncbi:MAG: crossover junction endodeoxyribonuclease RuvC [Planctomycetaceae bacterium]|jgi:crossover junction endodeoxyribonuclease RuvC|nr:crossover junction endodeoxyribonuclease RuvC [Planctomycetaceae bacterium]
MLSLKKTIHFFIMKIILGVDPGLNTTGYGLIDVSSGKVRLLEAGIVRSSSKILSHKIKEIYDGIEDVIDSFHPSSVALEQLYSHYDRPTTAILMGHARGCICLAAAQAGIDVYSYAATKVKKILTGNGHATKDQIQRAIKLELKLTAEPNPPDVADALAIAICHFYHGRININTAKDFINGVDRNFQIDNLVR